jgi:hypothetical protein
MQHRLEGQLCQIQFCSSNSCHSMPDSKSRWHPASVMWMEERLVYQSVWETNHLFWYQYLLENNVTLSSLQFSAGMKPKQTAFEQFVLSPWSRSQQSKCIGNGTNLKFPHVLILRRVVNWRLGLELGMRLRNRSMSGINTLLSLLAFLFCQIGANSRWHVLLPRLPRWTRFFNLLKHGREE